MYGRRLLTLTALTIVLLFTMNAGINVVVAQASVDYDADDDGLIEIEWLEQLDAVRWDLDGDGFADDGGNSERYFAAFPDAAEYMGCPDHCHGYELARDLDFKSAGSYASGAVNGKWTSGNGWLPIGLSLEEDDALVATFNGNGHTIVNLYINRQGENQPQVAGLIGYLWGGGNISRLGLVNVDVIGMRDVGALVGYNGGSIIDSYAIGRVSGNDNVGGLAGYSNNITSSYAAVNVSGKFRVGGLIGEGHDIKSSYATGEVSGEDRVGGLAGEGQEITLSYATGNVSGISDVGGLAGSGGHHIF